MNEGLPQQNTPEDTGEAFVPQEQLEDFYKLEGLAEDRLQTADKLAESAVAHKKNEDKLAKIGTTIGAGSVAALAVPAIGPALGAIGLAGSIGAWVGAYGESKKTDRARSGAQEATEAAHEASGKTREIVRDELIRGGARNTTKGLVVTEEQKKIAHEEMEKKMNE